MTAAISRRSTTRLPQRFSISREYETINRPGRPGTISRLNMSMIAGELRVEAIADEDFLIEKMTRARVDRAGMPVLRAQGQADAVGAYRAGL